MANRLEFFTSLDASGFAAGMANMERMAASASLRLNNTLSGFNGGKRSNRDAVRDYETRLAQKAAGAAAYEEVQLAKKTAAEKIEIARQAIVQKQLFNQITLNKIAAEEKAAASAIRDSRLAEIAMVARQGGIGAASGGHGHRYGGQGGVISEIAVIGHELLQGRGSGRVLGSVSILAQRLGLLGTLVKSTAQDAIKLAFAEEKLAGSLARAAIATEVSTTATVAEKEAAIAASLAQNTRAKKAVEAAEMEAAAATVSLGPLGWALIAIIALTAATFAWYHHAKKVREEQENLKNLTDLTSRSFEEQAKAVKSAAESHQAEIDRLNELAKSENGVRDAIDETIKMMRERAQLEQELKSAQGGTKMQLAQMEIAAAEAELEFINASNTELAKKVELDNQSEIAASKRMDDFKGGTGNISESAMNQANEKTILSAKVMDAVKKKLKEGPLVGSGEMEFIGLSGGFPVERVRPANESDQLSVNVDEKPYSISLNEAIDAHKKDAEAAEKLAAIEKEISDTLKSKQKLTNDDIGHLEKLKTDAATLENSLGLKKEFLPKIARAEGLKSSFGRTSGDSLVRTVNFLGSAKGQIETLAQQANQIARAHHETSKRIEQNTRPRLKPPGESHYPIH